ncbi:hypothetical protein EHQ23_16910 [Leptospira bourretii]|uniref:Uncharacterized protein n=1 Tax=Leptospira bourretii TaxID=2484962 RepID=A0A4R9IN17_9LEPT|nr:hypothetical protein [Leptospira bourretii]TGK79290.1 hypothetical protein EHQ23_16910 [Leptospira bourretii]TGK92472.1 hypothetical protein EHQ26_08700 [Leptospira bourretii]TGL35701.1 hypothetical protein EHQ45_09035 [Leptospira bourretii]
MNLISIIQSHIDSILETRELNGLKEIIRHLRRAEELYLKGKNTDEKEFYTETILRNNLAFEAILREAFHVYSKSQMDSKSLFEIENYFLNENILSERILTEFKNYRQKWRNLSAHSYSIYFDEHDALFSLTSLYGFSSILLSEILRRVIYENELSMANNEEKPKEQNQKLVDFVTELIIKWANTLDVKKEYQLKEIEITARLQAFLEIHSPKELKIDYEYIAGSNIRLDFLITQGTEKVIIELKRGLYITSVKESLDQLKKYMQLISNADGIVFLYSPGFENLVGMDIYTFDFSGETRNARVIHPASMDNF